MYNCKTCPAKNLCNVPYKTHYCRKFLSYVHRNHKLKSLLNKVIKDFFDGYDIAILLDKASKLLQRD